MCNRKKEKGIKGTQINSKDFSLKFLGNNANSLMSKLVSLENLLSVENPSAVFLKEIKLGRAGRIRTPSSDKYTWYKLHRTEASEKGQKGGGIALGVLNSLEPSWEYIEKEVQNSTKNGASLIIQMDGNLWAGSNIIEGDPDKQNQNGKIFQTLLERNQHLSVVNALKVCDGKITREKNTIKGTERRMLDFFIVCD